MAKKNTDSPDPEEHREIRHARIELPEADYQRLKSAAERLRLPVAAFIRMAVMKAVEDMESR